MQSSSTSCLCKFESCCLFWLVRIRGRYWKRLVSALLDRVLLQTINTSHDSCHNVNTNQDVRPHIFFQKNDRIACSEACSDMSTAKKTDRFFKWLHWEKEKKHTDWPVESIWQMRCEVTKGCTCLSSFVCSVGFPCERVKTRKDKKKKRHIQQVQRWALTFWSLALDHKMPRPDAMRYHASQETSGHTTFVRRFADVSLNGMPYVLAWLCASSYDTWRLSSRSHLFPMTVCKVRSCFWARTSDLRIMGTDSASLTRNIWIEVSTCEGVGNPRTNRFSELMNLLKWRLVVYGVDAKKAFARSHILVSHGTDGRVGMTRRSNGNANLYSSCPAVSRMSSRHVSSSMTTCLRYESSIGS